MRSIINLSSVHQGTVVVIDQGLYSLTNFIVGALLARVLLKDIYGTYVLVFSIIYIVMGIQRAAVCVPYTVYSQTEKHDELKTYTWSNIVHQFFLLIVFASIYALFSFNLFSSETMSGTKPLIASFAVVTTGYLFRDFVRSFLLASLKIWQSVFMGISINCFQLALLWLLFVIGSLTLSNSFLVLGICSFFPSIIILLVNFNIKIHFDKVIEDFIFNLRLGKWILLTNSIANISSKAYIWFLAFFIGNESVAVLGVCWALSNLPGPLLQGMYSFILPKMVHSKGSNDSKPILGIMRKSIIALSPVLVLWLFCGIFFGNYLLDLIYSPKYAGFHMILIILISNMLITGVSIPINAAFEALKRPDFATKGQVAGFLITMLFGSLMVFIWGIYGAALGILMSNLGNFFIRLRGLHILRNKSLEAISKPPNGNLGYCKFT